MIKKVIKNIPILNNLAIKLYCKIKKIPRITSSSNYWEERYRYGWNSGTGSYGNLAEFKAEEINAFIETNQIDSVIEFGCGDGNQLQYYNFNQYTGFDVSRTIINFCKDKYAQDTNKQFYHISEYNEQKADLAMSIDVIFHLIEEDVFNAHMEQLFSASKKYVIVYSSNTDEYDPDTISHVRHWKFTNWVEKNAKDYNLIQKIPNKFPYEEGNENTSLADFYIYKKANIE